MVSVLWYLKQIRKRQRTMWSTWQVVWPDLAKFRHFGKILKDFGNIWRAYLVLATFWTYFGEIMYGIGQRFIVVNGPNWKHKLAIGHTVGRSEDKPNFKFPFKWVQLLYFLSPFLVSQWGPFSIRSFIPAWPDLAKFRHLSEFLKVLGKFLMVYLVFGNILTQLWQFFAHLGKFSLL